MGRQAAAKPPSILAVFGPATGKASSAATDASRSATLNSRQEFHPGCIDELTLSSMSIQAMVSPTLDEVAREIQIWKPEVVYFCSYNVNQADKNLMVGPLAFEGYDLSPGDLIHQANLGVDRPSLKLSPVKPEVFWSLFAVHCPKVVYIDAANSEDLAKGVYGIGVQSVIFWPGTLVSGPASHFSRLFFSTLRSSGTWKKAAAVTNDAVGRYSEMVSACYNFAWQGYRYLCIRSSGAPKIAINCCYSPAKLMAEVDFDPQNCSLDEPEDKDLNRLVLPTDSGSEIAINLNVKDRCEVFLVMCGDIKLMERPRPESLQKALTLALLSGIQSIRDVHLCAAGDCNVRKRVLEESVDMTKLNSGETLYERLEITLQDWKKMDIYFQEGNRLPNSFSRSALLQKVQKLLTNSVTALRKCHPPKLARNEATQTLSSHFMSLPDASRSLTRFVEYHGLKVPVATLNTLRSVPSLALTLGEWPSWAGKLLLDMARDDCSRQLPLLGVLAVGVDWTNEVNKSQRRALRSPQSISKTPSPAPAPADPPISLEIELVQSFLIDDVKIQRCLRPMRTGENTTASGPGLVGEALSDNRTRDDKP